MADLDDGCGVGCTIDDCTCGCAVGPVGPGRVWGIRPRMSEVSDEMNDASIFPDSIRPAAHQPEPIGRDHDCVIKPDAQPVAVSAAPDHEARISRLERDLDGLRRQIRRLEPMPG